MDLRATHVTVFMWGSEDFSKLVLSSYQGDSRDGAHVARLVLGLVASAFPTEPPWQASVMILKDRFMV